MPYQFQPDESVRAGVKRIVSEEIESAVEHIADRNPVGEEETIHEVRKSIKKIRAVVRLVREPLGGEYATENVRWRNIGRRLSAIRDADAILGTFERLRKKYHLHLTRDGAGNVRRLLLGRKEAAANNTDAALRSAVRSIRSGRNRVERWMFDQDGFALIAPGLDAAYRRGRKALAAVQNEPTDTGFHELRKRTKDLWYAARLLQPVWPEPMQDYENTLDDLQEWLGEDHNLSVLSGLLKEASPSPSVEAAIVKEQQDLRSRSLAVAGRIYKTKPGSYSREIKRYWRGWHNQS